MSGSQLLIKLYYWLLSGVSVKKASTEEFNFKSITQSLISNANIVIYLQFTVFFSQWKTIMHSHGMVRINFSVYFGPPTCMLYLLTVTSHYTGDSLKHTLLSHKLWYNTVRDMDSKISSAFTRNLLWLCYKALATLLLKTSIVIRSFDLFMLPD